MRCMRRKVHLVSDHVFGKKVHHEHGGDYYDLIMLHGAAGSYLVATNETERARAR